MIQILQQYEELKLLENPNIVFNPKLSPAIKHNLKNTVFTSPLISFISPLISHLLLNLLSLQKLY